MKNNNYINVIGWMANDLNLKSNELLIYAMVFGFSQDGKTKFTGSLTYICNTLNLSRNTVIKVLKSLEKKELVLKTQTSTNNITYNSYTVNHSKFNINTGSSKNELGSAKNELGSAKNDILGSAKTAPNNTINNITNYIYALDFLKQKHLSVYNDLIMKFKNQIDNWDYFVTQFNAVCDKEAIEFDVRKLRGRFTGYANTWIYNAKRKAELSIIKNTEEVSLSSRPEFKKIS
jgi:predicted transcriptional regulator